ncbi:hypothetical protein HU200_031152 [Digitaria exilis]|uniref:Protein PHLOEM PROTEIN 2-LIKE A1 n=1 Tax=Digitaria exilis TaxID=1010633 RepID=A0A835ETA5_9POAL|nr:hypothetical protein HU200_031152 [Digitaria exilis]
MGTSPSRHEASSSDSSRAGDGHAVPVATSSAASGTGSNSNLQAQSKRAPAPHMFHEIVAQEKTATATELEDRVRSEGIYLAGKTKVINKCKQHELFPWLFLLSGVRHAQFNFWLYCLFCSVHLSLTSESEIEAVSLQNVCWLEIHGKLELSHLNPGVSYDVVFEVMLTEPSYGWTTPVNLRLKFPDGTVVQERKETLQEKPRNQWLELKAGEVKAQPGQKGEVEISLFEYDGGQWKKGLIVKGIKIVPKE